MQVVYFFDYISIHRQLFSTAGRKGGAEIMQKKGIMKCFVQVGIVEEA